MRANQMKDVGVALRKVEPPTELHINLDKHKISPEHLKLGNIIKAKIHGKIVSVHQDQYGKTARIGITKFDHSDTAGNGSQD